MDGAFDLTAPFEETVNGERVSHLRSGPAAITVLVPCYKDDPRPLLRALGGCADAVHAHVIVFDDGSGDCVLSSDTKRTLEAYPGPATLVTSFENVGRAQARNRLLSYAQTSWVLLLDADMLPDDHLFIARYLDALAHMRTPSLVAGGFSLKRVKALPRQTLHALQSAASECLPAETRAAEPGRYVFTSNILVHRDILDQVPFDPGFTGWGWEDVDWGLRVAESFNVQHIENTATHLGLDTDRDLIRKYETSGANFARMAASHPEAASTMPLFKAARMLAKLGPLNLPLRLVCRQVARTPVLPGRLRLKALKTLRASAYAKVL